MEGGSAPSDGVVGGASVVVGGASVSEFVKNEKTHQVQAVLARCLMPVWVYHEVGSRRWLLAGIWRVTGSTSYGTGGEPAGRHGERTFKRKTYIY